MSAIRFDDTWFRRERGVLFRTWLPARDARARDHRSVRALQQGVAVAEEDRRFEPTARVLDRLPRRHEAAVRAHMQLYRASLEATALVPSEALVQAAVQIEWLWYTTPFKRFYRDHLAHVMKVATMALCLWLDREGPLADAGESLVDGTARRLAEGKLGCAALRAAARRLGNPEEALRTAEFWRVAVLEATRLAGLLHDLAYPSIMATKVQGASEIADPLAPFAGDRREAAAHLVRRLGDRLIAAPFCGGALPARPLTREAREAFIDMLLQSHSLQAGARILEFARDADRLWRLTPLEAFVIEWAALAASLHDYDKAFELAARYGARPEDAPPGLPRWFTKAQNVAAIRPCFQRDPVSYMVAMADQLQDFGRLNHRPDGRADDRAGLSLRYPVSAVALAVNGDRRATISLTFSDDVTSEERAGIVEHKNEAAETIFSAKGWFDHAGLFTSAGLEMATHA